MIESLGLEMLTERLRRFCWEVGGKAKSRQALSHRFHVNQTEQLASRKSHQPLAWLSSPPNEGSKGRMQKELLDDI